MGNVLYMTSTENLTVAQPVASKGDRIVLTGPNGGHVGTVTRVLKNVYGTLPGFSVAFDDGSRLVIGDRFEVVSA